MSRYQVSRRSVLMGGGGLLALPLLEAFHSKKALAAGTSDPRRLILIHLPNGTQTRKENPTWFSAADGPLTAANAPVPLQPFTSNLGDISVLKYLTQTALYNNLLQPNSGDHDVSALFTGQMKGQAVDSFDVAYTKKTPTASRVIALGNSSQTGDGNADIELSQNGGKNVVPELSPMSLYNTYFKNLMTSTVAAPPLDIVRNPGILGMPNAALSDLNQKLGKNDRNTLAAFIQGLVDLKNNLTSTAPVTSGCVPISAPTQADTSANCVSGAQYFTRMMAFNSLIATAFQCDLFRSVSISFGCETGASNYMSYGNGAGAPPYAGTYPSSLVYQGGEVGNIQDHSISHQIDNATNSGSVNPAGLQINMTRDRLHMYLIVDLINKLKAVKDPSQSAILDNTCIFAAFSTYDGEHRPDLTLGQPAIVAGGKNFMKPGRSIDASQWDVNDIYYTFSTFLGMGLSGWYPMDQIALPYGSKTGRKIGSNLVPL